jgi:hypothetical protein
MDHQISRYEFYVKNEVVDEPKLSLSPPNAANSSTPTTRFGKSRKPLASLFGENPAANASALSTQVVFSSVGTTTVAPRAPAETVRRWDASRANSPL